MNYIVFQTQSYTRLGHKIAGRLKAERGEVEAKVFGDGERNLCVLSSVRERDVVLVGGTTNESTTMELFDLACGLTEQGCRSLKILIPYFGYSTMERATRDGEVVTAKNRARLISAIPIAPFGNEVMMLDLHSEGIPFYFEGAVRARHLYAKPLIMKAARNLAGTKFTLGSVDAGRAKWVESLANDLNVNAGFIYKRRSSGGKVSVSGVNVSVQGENVVIYDDMIRSGSSILQAAQVYKEAGAQKIWAVTTHGIFSSGGLQRLRDSQLFEKIVCTDSHCAALDIADPFLEVLSTDEIFAKAIVGSSYE